MLEPWRKEIRDAVTDVETVGSRFSVDPAALKRVVARYPMQITSHYLGLIREPGDAIWRQCIPGPEELDDGGLSSDPLNERRLTPVPGLIHRYPDRAVMLVSSACATFCRFCLRKRHLGLREEGGNPGIEPGLAYIARTPGIRDVILSGGDPLLLSDERIEEILSRLHRIPHVEIVRIGTRIPVTLPSRVTPALCRRLKRHHPLFINTHFNHPREITVESAEACRRLAEAGIPLGNQTVLLKGVNDDPEVMARLTTGLLSIRVKPYYLHQMDLVRGTGHFRTPLRTGLEIMERLRGYCSGLAVPYFVVDLPGGKGKVPILPGGVKRKGNVYYLRNYLGETVRYRDP
jgi:lysine 2,3-aminomutase